jgi:acetyl-CoA C-acetyltransferase
MYTDYDYTRVETTTRAAARAYAEAEIKNPREEVSMAEVHGCFSVTEAVTMEDLQFSSQGKVADNIMSGRFNLDGATASST